jgi:hypothetical protein
VALQKKVGGCDEPTKTVGFADVFECIGMGAAEVGKGIVAAIVDMYGCPGVRHHPAWRMLMQPTARDDARLLI